MAREKRLVQKRTSSVIYGGGLDIVTPPLKVSPGKLVQAKNFEADVSHGYRLMSGYERFDGRSSPTRSDWFALGVTDVTGFVVDELLTGADSGATGTIFDLGVEGLYLVVVTGNFDEGEVVSSASASSTTTSVSFANITVSDDDVLADVRYNKEAHFRALIETVPGIGPVRGVHQILDTTIAVRDFDVTEARMYRQTAAGWTEVLPCHLVFFDNRTNKINSSLVVNDGNGNFATIGRVFYTTVDETEGYGTTFDYVGGFLTGDKIQDGITNLATVTQDAFEWVLEPGGRCEFISHNFSGDTDEYAAYGADGVNPGYEYNPVTDQIIPIYTAQLDLISDIPVYVAAFVSTLVFGYSRGVIRNSEPNDITLWDAAAGAREIAVGAEINGLDTSPLSLVIGTQRSTYVLTGSVPDNFELDVASAKTGVAAHTMQHIGTTYALDDRGIIELSRVQAFGNFENATVSRNIQSIVSALKPFIVASTVSYSKNVYRLIASDGRGISMTFEEGGILSFSLFELEREVFVAATGEDDTGQERLFFGGDDGFVYEWDLGRSFDGDEKEAWIQPTANFLESPTLRKKFFRMYINFTISGTATVKTYSEFSSGSIDVESTLDIDSSISGINSKWDIGLWDVAVWDARLSPDAVVNLDGTGDAISTIFYHKSDREDDFTIRDVTYHYKPRRLQRGDR